MQNIPTYVYVLFLFLLYIGVKRCFTRTIHISRLLLAPALLVFLCWDSAIHLFGVSVSTCAVLIIGNFIGSYFGYRLVQGQRVQVNKNQNLIQIPGNVFMLVLVMVIFFIEFFIHYAIDAQWSIINNPGILLMAILISGVVSGISIGRNLNYYLKFKSANEYLTISSK